MTTLGAVFLPQLPPERLRAVARAADDAGLDELWLWEDCFLESGIARVRRARELIDSGRAAERRSDPHPVVVYLLAATGSGAAARVDAERRRFGYEPTRDVGVAGDAREVVDGVRRWADAGADTVVLQPLSDETDPEGFVRFVAQEVRPLLK